jgi:hypothetical protein
MSGRSEALDHFTKPPRKCQRAGAWVCPEIQDESIVGLLKPLEAVQVKRNDRLRNLAGKHVTCLPAELFDESFQIGPGHLYARGESKIGSPLAPKKDAKGRREIVDERGVPLNEFAKAQFDYYICECGVTKPGREGMVTHLYSNPSCEKAENGRGDILTRASLL